MRLEDEQTHYYARIVCCCCHRFIAYDGTQKFCPFSKQRLRITSYEETRKVPVNNTVTVDTSMLMGG